MDMRLNEELCELLAEAVASEYATFGEGVEVHQFVIHGRAIRVIVEADVEVEMKNWNQAQVLQPSSG